MQALADLGYKPEQVSKILITHKHADHTGELKSFPNVIPVYFTDGAYHN